MLKPEHLSPRNLLLLAVALAISACSANPATVSDSKPIDQTQEGRYFDKSSDDNNGVAPLPNNGSQNFGRKW